MKRLFLFAMVLCGTMTTTAQDKQLFDDNWQFTRNGKTTNVNLPHDWDIYEGPNSGMVGLKAVRASTARHSRPPMPILPSSISKVSIRKQRSSSTDRRPDNTAMATRLSLLT